MKRSFTRVFLVAFLVFAPLFIFSQPPHPNNGNGAPGPGNAPVGATLGDGVFILLTFVVAYAGRKSYIIRTKAEAGKV